MKLDIKTLIPFIIYVTLLIIMCLQSYFNYRLNDKLSQNAMEQDLKDRYDNIKYVNLTLFIITAFIFMTQISILTFLPAKSHYGIPITLTYFK